jgi:hypothetical protein
MIDGKRVPVCASAHFFDSYSFLHAPQVQFMAKPIHDVRQFIPPLGRCHEVTDGVSSAFEIHLLPPFYRATARAAGHFLLSIVTKESKNTLFGCKKSESSFADTTPQALSNQKLLPLIKILPNLWAQHFSSSSFPTVGYSTTQFTAHSTKETALFYNSINLLNLSDSLVCTLTAVYSDSRDPLTKCFN